MTVPLNRLAMGERARIAHVSPGCKQTYQLLDSSTQNEIHTIQMIDVAIKIIKKMKKLSIVEF